MEIAASENVEQLRQQLVSKDNELKSLINKNGRLEQTVTGHMEIIKELQEQLEQGSNADQSILLSTTNKISTQEKRVYQRTIDELNEQLEDAKNHCYALKNTLEVENRRSSVQQQEIAKRKEQMQQSTELIAKLKEENKQLKEKCADLSWERREEELRYQMNERVIEDEANIVALETKLAQRQREVCKLEEELHTTREGLEAEIRRLKLDLQNVHESEKQRTNECSLTQKQLIEANAEVHALRSRLNVSTPLRVKRTESMEDMLIGQVKALTQQIEQIKAGQGDAEETKTLRERVGTLATTNEFVDRQLQQTVAREQQLTSDLQAAHEEIESLKMKTEQLEKTLGDRANDTELTHKYLLDENSKIKQQKAELRCRFLELQRELSTVKAFAEKAEAKANEELVAKQSEEIKTAKRAANEALIERDEMSTHADNLERRLTQSEAEIALLTRKLERADQTLREQAEAEEAKFAQLKKDCLALSNEKVQLQLAAQDLDKQCEQLQQLRETAERQAREKAAKCADLEVRLAECQQEIGKSVDAAESTKSLLKERDRLQEKVSYLTEELRETHTDYREELANLARQMSETKRKDATENETFSIKTQELENQKRQLETDVRILKRQLEECTKERERSSHEVAQLGAQLAALKTENAKLKAGLTEAVVKIEAYKAEADRLRASSEELAIRVEQLGDQRRELEDALECQKQTNAESLKLVAYLQSQVESKEKKKMGSFRRPISPRQMPLTTSSTLTLTSSSEMSAASSVESLIKQERRENIELEHQVQVQRDRLDQAKLVLRERLAATLPQLAAPPRSPALTTTPRRPLNQSNSLPPSTPGGGTMRHDIPHRWKPFFVLTQLKCAVCLDGLTRVRHASKCVECKLVVHRHCSANILNTCGLPMMCADFYLDEARRIRSQSQQGIDQIDQQPDSRMTGWIKLWRSDEPNVRWRDAWARMDGHSLAFFDNENLATNDGSAFYAIKLAQQGWRVHFQSRPDDDRALKTEDVPYLVEIKIHPENSKQQFEPYRLYLMAPTMPAKQRWVNALQIATNKRMFERRTSSLNLRNNYLIRLESPHNLTIHSSVILDNMLILGCQEGLFFTWASDPRVPFNVAGVGAVFQLELIVLVDMMVVITGSSRCVSFIHLSDIRAAFESRHPAVKATTLDHMTSCHLLMCADLGGDSRYLCVADPDQVYIMQYNARLGIFAPHKRVATSEPATCLTQIGERLLLGADTFYAVDLRTGDKTEFLQRTDPTLRYASARDAARQDFPVGAVLLSDVEVLLAYQNFGICVDLNGNRMRETDVDWARSPLEFVYTAPYLYVVHFESVEVFEVLPYAGLKTKAMEQCNFFTMAQPHYIGLGRARGDVLFSTSKLNMTDIVLFNAFSLDQKSRNVFKRKTSAVLGSLKRQTSDEKRNKY